TSLQEHRTGAKKLPFLRAVQPRASLVSHLLKHAAALGDLPPLCYHVGAGWMAWLSARAGNTHDRERGHDDYDRRTGKTPDRAGERGEFLTPAARYPAPRTVPRGVRARSRGD